MAQMSEQSSLKVPPAANSKNGTFQHGMLTYQISEALRSVDQSDQWEVHTSQPLDKNTNQLRELNSQLAHYIENIRMLESKNKSLQLELLCVNRNVDSYNLMVQNMLTTEITGLRRMLERFQDQRKFIDKDIDHKQETLSELEATIKSLNEENLKQRLINEQDVVEESIAAQETKRHMLDRKNIGIEDKKKQTKTLIEELTQKLMATIRLDKDEKENAQNLKGNRDEQSRQLVLLKRTYANELSKVNEEPIEVHHNVQCDELLKLVGELQEDHDRNLKQTERTLRDDLLNEYKESVDRFQRRRYLSSMLSPVSIHEHGNQCELQSKVHELQRSVSEIASTNIALHDTLQKINQMIVRDDQQAEIIYKKKLAYAEELEKRLENLSTHCGKLECTDDLIEQEVLRYHSLLYGTTSTDGLKYVADKINKLMKEQTK